MVNCDSEELFKSEGIIYLNSLPGNTVWSLTQVLINRKYKQFNLKISFQINNNTATELIRKSNNLGENIAREVHYIETTGRELWVTCLTNVSTLRIEKLRQMEAPTP